MRQIDGIHGRPVTEKDRSVQWWLGTFFFAMWIFSLFLGAGDEFLLMIACAFYLFAKPE